MRTKILATIASAAFAIATSDAAARDKSPSPPFDASAFTWSQGEGANSLNGEALMRTRLGEVRTCAGLPVQLVPSTPFVEAFVRRKYGAIAGGLYGAQPLLYKQIKLDAQVTPFVRTGVCNAQGQFSFPGLPNGAWFVITTVTWEDPGDRRSAYLSYLGGEIAQLVRLEGGRSTSVVITH